MKTKEELNIIKEEVEALNKKLAELTEVSGGGASDGCRHVRWLPARPAPR